MIEQREWSQKSNIIWYEELAEYYDLLDGVNVPYKRVVEILDGYFKRDGVKSVLDFACGTGGFTIPLKEKGYDVVGVDICSSMLEIAERKIRQAGLEIPLYEGDIQCYQVGEFDALICMFNSIGDLSKEGFLLALQNMRKNLKDGGLFCFDVLNYQFAENEEQIENFFIDSSFIHRDIRGERSSRNILDRENKTMQVEQVLNIYIPGREAKKIFANCVMQMYEKEEVGEMLRVNGFEVIKKFGKFSTKNGLEPFSEYSPFIGILARVGR